MVMVQKFLHPNNMQSLNNLKKLYKNYCCCLVVMGLLLFLVAIVVGASAIGKVVVDFVGDVGDGDFSTFFDVLLVVFVVEVRFLVLDED
jgi:hypothetical protein